LLLFQLRLLSLRPVMRRRLRTLGYVQMCHQMRPPFVGDCRGRTVTGRHLLI